MEDASRDHAPGSTRGRVRHLLQRRLGSRSRGHTQRHGGNSFDALDLNVGSKVWSFDNSAAQGGDDKLMGIISGGASIDYLNDRLYFASRAHMSGGSTHTLWCLSFDGTNANLVWSKDLGKTEARFCGAASCMWGPMPESCTLSTPRPAWICGPLARARRRSGQRIPVPAIWRCWQELSDLDPVQCFLR